MFDPKTAVVELQSRLGRAGSIQAWDPWDSRRSVDDAKWWVSRIARLSHGLGEAEDYVAHFDRVVNQMKHESVLEFVPDFPDGGEEMHLPGQSFRRRRSDGFQFYDRQTSEEGSANFPASAFLVEAPIFVARQWMRHRSFAYLEMSRRYTKGSRVAWEFYGSGDSLPRWSDLSVVEDPVPGEEYDYFPGHVDKFHQACEAEYQRRLDAGWPNEIARGCMPVEAMTKFWTCGFDRDWEAFLKLRDDAHAQPEIRSFASWIAGYLKAKCEIAEGGRKVSLLDEAEKLAYGDDIRARVAAGTADTRAQVAWDAVKGAAPGALPRLTAAAWTLEAKCAKTPRAVETCRKAAATWRIRA
jgi:flavin-dependent thymidylate synthase